jgi:hypothetical protein
VRDGPLVAATVNATLPDPVPPGVTPVIHASLELAVHAHEGPLSVMPTLSEPPAAVAVVLGLASVAPQPSAWLTVKV